MCFFLLKHFECRNARKIWNCAAVGRAVRNVGTLSGKRGRAGHMSVISPEAIGCGSTFSFNDPRENKEKARLRQGERSAGRHPQRGLAKLW